MLYGLGEIRWCLEMENNSLINVKWNYTFNADVFSTFYVLQ